MAVAQLLAHQQLIDQLKGKFILVRYDIPGESTWHARLVLSHVTAGEWVILTPDGDIYSEDYSSGSQEVETWRVFDPNGVIPIGVDANHIYGFNPVPDHLTIQRLVSEGDIYAAHEKLQRGLPVHALQPPAAAAPGAVVAAAPPPAGPPNLAGSGAPVGGVVAAAAAAPGQVANVGGNVGGHAAAVGAAPAVDVDQEDARTLAITRDAQGQRFKEFRTAALECKETSFNDWPVAGPRTVLHVLARMVEHGGSPVAHSQAWRVACKFQPADKPAQDHEMLCRILQTMVVHDQLDASNLASAELVARAIQRIEEQHKFKLAAVEDAGESSLFLGTSGGSSMGTIISPKLSEWIGAEMQKEAAIAKERRKAREERALSRKNEKGEKDKSDK